MGAEPSKRAATEPEAQGQNAIDAQMLPVEVATSRKDIGALNFGLPIGAASDITVHFCIC